MTSTLALVSLFFATLHRPIDRAAFVQSMAKVQDEWTMAQVKAALGEPDDVWEVGDKFNDNQAAVTWCYGAKGHHTMPTLGFVQFENGKVVRSLGGDGSPPSPSVIGEDELQQSMRVMFRGLEGYPQSSTVDPQRLIQSANMLISKGQEKALAILAEYARVQANDSVFQGNWLYWLVRVAFTSKTPGGICPVPAIGAISPAPPSDLSSWPTYPVKTVSGVPYVLIWGISIGGEPEPFSMYLRANQKDWELRPTAIIPPDDPFPGAADLVAHLGELFPNEKGDTLARMQDTLVIDQLFALVKNAYRPSESIYRRPCSKANLQKLHEEFLKLKCHWDAGKQNYVRGTPDMPPVIRL